jgi:DNA-directed RNA polymerase subunit beta'
MGNLLDPREQNRELQQSITQALEELFPVESGGKTLRLKNVKIVDTLNNTDYPKQKEVKLSRKSWEVPIYGDLELTDSSGTVISTRAGVRLGAIPKMTTRFSAIINGNEYQVANQLRRKAGVFSRLRENGELEAEFNVEGKSFRIELDPLSQQFFLTLRGKNRRYHVWPILSMLGVSDSQIQAKWGSKLLELNRVKGQNAEESDLRDLQKQLNSRSTVTSMQEIKTQLRDRFLSMKMDAEVNELTLGSPHSAATGDAILDASFKLIQINKGEVEQDYRDSLVFKKLLTPDTQILDHFRTNAPAYKGKIANAMRRRETVSEVFPANFFARPITQFFTTADLSSTPPQTNPIAMIVNARKTTPMGASGIQSTHAITSEARDVDPSHVGFIDTLATPEGTKVGVTMGLASEVIKRDGEMATPVINQSGEISYVTPMQFYKAVVGFPDEYIMKNGKPVPKNPEAVNVMFKNRPTQVTADKVQYWVRDSSALFDFNSNLVPFLHNTQGNRGSTAGRMLTQALPLENAETPLTVVRSNGDETFEDVLGKLLLPTLRDETGDKTMGGTVTNIDKDYVYVKTAKGEVKIGLYSNFPLNEEGFLDTTPVVEVGQEVKPDTILAKSNYTDKSGRLAMGKNLTVAYLPFKGNSFEDGATITESAAKKLAHITIHRENVYTNPKNTVFNLSRYKAFYPEDINPANDKKLTAEGLPKIGQRFSQGEVVAAYLVKKDLDALDKSLSKINKSLFVPYTKGSAVWDNEDMGEVIDVRRNGKNIDIYIKAVHPLREGDKISSRYGDKHIVGKVIPDDEAPHREDGTPVEVMVNPAGVPGRMNVGQIMDTASSKLALKRGVPYVVKNFNPLVPDQAKVLLQEMEDEGVPVNEKLRDGKTGEYIKNPVFVGVRQYLKLRHIVDKKLSARGLGAYDIDEQPAGKAKKIGVMETYALLAHGSKGTLHDSAVVTGQKNEEYFRDLQLGLPPSPPRHNFTYDKLVGYMRAAGADTEKKGNRVQLLPLMDKKITELSSGKINDPGMLLKGKNLAPIKGGLFDPDITGGVLGGKYSHFDLPVRLPNPMTERAIQSVLGLNNAQYEALFTSPQKLEAALESLKTMDVGLELEKTKKALKTTSPTNVNKLNTRARILGALDEKGISPYDAYTVSKVLIIPPKFRTIVPLPSGDLAAADLNYHYRNVGLISASLGDALKEDLLDDAGKANYTQKLYESVQALQGFVEPQAYNKQKYRGALKEIGESKKGQLFGKAWGKRQDLSGRSTIGFEPSLGLDEVGVPYDMAKVMFQPLVVKRLKESGFSASDAYKESKSETEVFKTTLRKVMEDTPVLLNRAPSLHKHSIQGFKPKLLYGKDIKLNPLITAGFNVDSDGDTMSVSVPVSYEATQEARGLFPSKILFKHGDNSLVPSLSQDYAYGVTKLSEIGPDTGKTFDTIDDAKKAKIDWTHQFMLGGKKMTIGQWELNHPLPEKWVDYTRVYSGKGVSKFLDTLAKEESSDVFQRVIDRYKDLGAMYAYKHGATISLSDLSFDRAYRDNIIGKYKPIAKKAKTEEEKVQVYSQMLNEIEDAETAFFKTRYNNLYDLVDGGALSKSKGTNVRQVLTAPGLVADSRNRVIPIPIVKSYAEGLSTFDYYNTMPGVRKGVVDKGINTQDSGALNKSLVSVTRRTLIVEEDCKTSDGIDFEVGDSNLLDRTASETTIGVVTRGELITGKVVREAKLRGILSLKARSPLTCESTEGICAQCYGALPNGGLPSIGTNVGILEGTALSERATQLTLRSFHSGGAVGKGKNLTASFPRVKQLLEVPNKIAGKAALSPVKGRVTQVIPNEIGGHVVEIGTAKVIVEPGLQILVEIGQMVEKGAPLSSGIIKPQELGELTDHLSAQKYIVDELNEVYDKVFHKKTFETVVRAVSDNAEITGAPEDSVYLRGDKTTKSKLDSINKGRLAEGKELIAYKPYFASIERLNTDNEDWFTRITTSYVKDGLSKGVSKMQWADIAGKDPIPAYIYGVDFGKPGKKGNTDGFY